MLSFHATLVFTNNAALIERRFRRFFIFTLIYAPRARDSALIFAVSDSFFIAFAFCCDAFAYLYDFRFHFYAIAASCYEMHASPFCFYADLRLI